MIQGEVWGRIASIDAPLATSVQAGDDFYFSYLFSPDAVNLSIQDQIGSYHFQEFELRIAENVLQSTGDNNSINVWAFEPIGEHYFVKGYSTQPFVGMAEPVAIIILSRWPTDNWLLSGEMIPTNLELSDFEYAVFSLEDSANPGPLIRGEIEAMNFSVIPEPTTGMLGIALGFIMLTGYPNIWRTRGCKLEGVDGS